MTPVNRTPITHDEEVPGARRGVGRKTPDYFYEGEVWRTPGPSGPSLYDLGPVLDPLHDLGPVRDLVSVHWRVVTVGVWFGYCVQS